PPTSADDPRAISIHQVERSAAASFDETGAMRKVQFPGLHPFEHPADARSIDPCGRQHSAIWSLSARRAVERQPTPKRHPASVDGSKPAISSTGKTGHLTDR